MFVRAESDLLTPFIGLTKFCQLRFPEIGYILEEFGRVNLIPVERAFRGLLSDPYSLPIQKPTAASTVLRRAIEPTLKHLAKNEQIKKLFRMKERGITDYIVHKLRNANEYNAKVFAAVYAASPDGVLAELTCKFETGRSVLELLVLRGGYGMGNRTLRNVLRADGRLHKYRRDKIRGLNRGFEDLFHTIASVRCPQEGGQRITDLWWGKHVESITMPPLQHQIHIEPQQAGNLNEWEDANHFQYKIHPITQYLDKYHLETYATAGLRPFIGYTTRNSMVPARIHFVEKNIILTKVKNLTDLISWTNITARDYHGVEVESNFPQCISYLLTLYLEVPPENITAFRASKKSGTISHHVRAPNFRESIVPDTLVHVYQQLTSDSSSHQTLRAKGIHLQLNYLHVMCHSIMLLTLPTMLSNTPLTRPSNYWVVNRSLSVLFIRDSGVTYTLA
jgi:hypothetical protein